MHTLSISRTLTPPIAQAARMALRLMTQIKQAQVHPLPHAQKRIEAFGKLIECLPLTQDEYCYFINRVGSTAELLAENENGAAIYQLREMHRKLVRMIADRT